MYVSVGFLHATKQQTPRYAYGGTVKTLNVETGTQPEKLQTGKTRHPDVCSRIPVQGCLGQ